ncbi:MAG: putative zinc-binding metallopeptidase [Deltaproteobacteria bacterium]|nr:putative zinc-binding metallopeptidase [Deltaproteobacteria bacterium]
MSNLRHILRPELDRIIHFVCNIAGISPKYFKQEIKIRLISSGKTESYFDEDRNIAYINFNEAGWEGFNPVFGRFWQYLVFHEIGHYFESFVARDPQFIRLFGDVDAFYDEKGVHKNLPKRLDERFVSRYAAKHPSEDWAETFATALIIRYFNDEKELKAMNQKKYYKKILYVYKALKTIKEVR